MMMTRRLFFPECEAPRPRYTREYRKFLVRIKAVPNKEPENFAGKNGVFHILRIPSKGTHIHNPYCTRSVVSYFVLPSPAHNRGEKKKEEKEKRRVASSKFGVCSEGAISNHLRNEWLLERAR
jgi:hypothetical protein